MTPTRVRIEKGMSVHEFELCFFSKKATHGVFEKDGRAIGASKSVHLVEAQAFILNVIGLAAADYVRPPAADTVVACIAREKSARVEKGQYRCDSCREVFDGEPRMSGSFGKACVKCVRNARIKRRVRNGIRRAIENGEAS